MYSQPSSSRSAIVSGSSPSSVAQLRKFSIARRYLRLVPRVSAWLARKRRRLRVAMRSAGGETRSLLGCQQTGCRPGQRESRREQQGRDRPQDAAESERRGAALGQGAESGDGVTDDEEASVDGSGWGPEVTECTTA